MPKLDIGLLRLIGFLPPTHFPVLVPTLFLSRPLFLSNHHQTRPPHTYMARSSTQTFTRTGTLKIKQLEEEWGNRHSQPRRKHVSRRKILTYDSHAHWKLFNFFLSCPPRLPSHGRSIFYHYHQPSHQSPTLLRSPVPSFISSYPQLKDRPLCQSFDPFGCRWFPFFDFQLRPSIVSLYFFSSLKYFYVCLITTTEPTKCPASLFLLN